jgi:hypothetical protein
MYKLGEITIELIRDRGLNKIRVNVIKGNRVQGFIKPI